MWLESVELAKERVGIRVAKGGHSIPPDVIERRYSRSIENLLTLYIPISDRFLVINNSGTVPEFIAQGGIAATLDLFNVKIWEKINQNGRD